MSIQLYSQVCNTMHSLIPIPTTIIDSSFLDLQGMSAFIYFGVVLSGGLLAIEVERSR